MAKNQFLNWKKSFKLPEMQFHEKKGTILILGSLNLFTSRHIRRWITDKWQYWEVFMAEGYLFSMSKIMKLLYKIKNKVEIFINKMCWIPFTTWKSSYQFKKKIHIFTWWCGFEFGLRIMWLFWENLWFFLQNHIISSKKI